MRNLWLWLAALAYVGLSAGCGSKENLTSVPQKYAADPPDVPEVTHLVMVNGVCSRVTGPGKDLCQSPCT